MRKKRKKRNKKKEKRGEKEGFSRSHFLFPFPLEKEKEEEKRKKKRKRKKKKWKKICEFTRLWKTKRPCLSFDRQGLKLCGFNLGKRQTFLPRKKQFGFAETRFVLAKSF